MWYDLIPPFCGLLFAALCFGIMRYVPSRREFDMHCKSDDERHSDIKLSLARIELGVQLAKTDIIREVTNGRK